VYYRLFEELFKQKSVGMLEGFLGIQIDELQFDKRSTLLQRSNEPRNFREKRCKASLDNTNIGTECSLIKTLAPILKTDPMLSVIFNLKILFPNNRRTI